MNEIINVLLLAGDGFMTETHWKQPGFGYSACGPFTKNKERIRKFKKSGDTGYVYKNKLDRGCVQYHMTYGDFKDFAKPTASDRFLRDKSSKMRWISNRYCFCGL